MSIRALIYGLNSVIHFWYTDFTYNVIGINDRFLITTGYFFLCSAGLIGYSGGYMLVNDCLIGGYENLKTSWLLLFCLLLGLVPSFLFSTITSSRLYFSFIVLFEVFNSAMMVIIQGICLSTVSNMYKGISYIFMNISSMALTTGPFPKVYGMLNDVNKEEKPNLAMLLSISVNVISATLVIMFIIMNKLCMNMGSNYISMKDISSKEGNEGVELQEKEEPKTIELN